MYCGSCLRDNALAAELVARGHDVTLLPLYTPLLTDDTNVSRPEVLFGGVNIYLQQHFAIFRQAPRFVDRLLDSPRLINALASRSISTDPRLLGDLTVAMLEGRDGTLRREFDKLLQWVATEPRPDVVNLTNSLLIGLAEPLSSALGRPVCCTLQGEDLFLNGLVEPYRSRALELMRQQVPEVDQFIAVSRDYAGFMTRHLQIPDNRITVAPLGINMSGHEAPADRPTQGSTRGHPAAPETSGDQTFCVGYLARVAPEKGLHVLAEAFQCLHKRIGGGPLALEAAGYLAPEHRPYLAEVQRSLERAGLSDQFRYHGTVDRAGKLDFLRRLDVLSVPATYDEPKGLFLLEAMASGVPIVQPRRGAFPEIVERTGGGILVEPDDVEGLAEGLHALWHDRGRREELARRGFDAVRVHYTIQRSADRLLEVYADVISRNLSVRPAAADPGAHRH